MNLKGTQTEENLMTAFVGYIHEGEEALIACPACAHPQAHFELLSEKW